MFTHEYSASWFPPQKFIELRCQLSCLRLKTRAKARTLCRKREITIYVNINIEYYRYSLRILWYMVIDGYRWWHVKTIPAVTWLEMEAFDDQKTIYGNDVKWPKPPQKTASVKNGEATGSGESHSWLLLLDMDVFLTKIGKMVVWLDPSQNLSSQSLEKKKS